MRDQNGDFNWGDVFAVVVGVAVFLYLLIGTIAPIFMAWTVGIISAVVIAMNWGDVTNDLESLTVTAMILLTLYLIPVMFMFLFNYNILNRDFTGITMYGVYTLTTLVGMFGIGTISYYNLREKFLGY